jgi:hypothetical protein
VQHNTGDLDFRHQRRDASLAPGAMGCIAPASLQPQDSDPLQ